MAKSPHLPPAAGCSACADGALQADYNQQHQALLTELGHHLRAPVVMAAVSAAVATNGHLLGSLEIAESLCLDAAQRFRDIREMANG